MTQHSLQGRTDAEILWFRRRSFLQAAAAWTTAGGFGTALAEQRSNVVELFGDATANGRKLTGRSLVQTGDEVQTGPGSNLIFVIGNAAFQVRQNSRMVVERGQTLNAVSMLRVITGGVASVWGQGSQRRIVMPTLSARTRGAGVYTEVLPEQDMRSYLCNCYGTVDVAAGRDHALSRADYHQAFWGEVQPKNGRMLTPAPAINHSDEELETLAELVGQRTAWQVLGRKGVRDGIGAMEQRAPEAHPAWR